ncbi:MAG: hypothetical protein BGO65_15565 [Afipia sp. 64-13]|nr:MAG: hypothetical protein BGO65_15565 [Afipia sp. 64-13]
MKIAAKSHDREGRASAEVGLLVQLKFRPDLTRRGACSEIVALTYVALLVIIIGRRKNPVLMAGSLRPGISSSAFDGLDFGSPDRFSQVAQRRILIGETSVRNLGPHCDNII